MVPCGDPAVLADFMADGCSAREYLRCMDREGIDAVVLYPSIGLFVPFLPSLSPRESADACRAYNEWIAEYRVDRPDPHDRRRARADRRRRARGAGGGARGRARARRA